MNPFKKIFGQAVNSSPDQSAVGFEIEDKPTPQAGKILLIIMATLLLLLGWRALDDAYDIPSEPETLSHCIMPFISINYNLSSRPISRYKYYPLEYPDLSPSECQFSPLEVKYQIPQLYQNFKNSKEKYDALERQINQQEENLSDVNRRLQENQRLYDLSLQEKMAEEKYSVYEPEALKTTINSLESQKFSLEQQINILKNQANNEKINFQPQEEILKEVAQRLSRDYNRAWAIYRLLVFLIQLAFTLPSFILILKIYFQQKAKDSPYTLIFTTLVGVTAILLARVAISYLWTLFLADLLATIWDFIKNTALLRTLTYYLGMLLVILVFGGAVYFLQKKVFDPQRVERRRLKKFTCPKCEFPLQLAQFYCPQCATKIRQTCSNCQKECFGALPFCPHCGRKQNVPPK